MQHAACNTVACAMQRAICAAQRAPHNVQHETDEVHQTTLRHGRTTVRPVALPGPGEHRQRPGGARASHSRGAIADLRVLECQGEYSHGIPTGTVSQQLPNCSEAVQPFTG
jgi:hypothetical protein